MVKIIFFLLFSLLQISLSISSTPSPTSLTNINNGISFEIIHRYSLESPRVNDDEPTNVIDNERFKRLVSLDMNSLDSFLYAVKVGIGNFDESPSYKPYYLRLDTSRPFIWTQCEGCTQCFPQSEPLYPKSRSKSYSPIPCADPRCTQRICNLKNCGYSTQLTEESSGELATETFTTFDNGNISLTFGCGLENHINYTNSNDDNNSIISGVLGLSNGSLSVVSQINTAYGLPRRYSYCLQPFSSSSGNSNAVPMQLRLGVNNDTISESGLKGAVIQTLGFVRGNLAIRVSSMSVNNNRLNLPPVTFIDQLGYRVVINTGAAITHLNEVAYVALKAELVKILSNYKGIRQVPGILGLDLCYEGVLGEGEHLPNITFATGGRFESMDGEFVVQPEGVFYRSKSEKSGQDVFCLAMVPSSNGYTILGAYQQVNKLIIYDLEDFQLLYKDQDCSQFN